MQWKTLNENNLYEISDTGLIRRKENAQVLTGSIVSGYKSVKLTFPFSKQRRFYVHRLVAEHYLINPDPKHKTYVNHIDGNKLNNNMNNLEYVSPRENNLHYYQELRKNTKKKKHFEKAIPVIQYDLLHNKLAEYSSLSQAHKITGVSVVQIARAIHGEVLQANGFIWEEGSTTMQEGNLTSSVRNIQMDEDIV